MKQRLQKILAAAGLGSRRECEQLILDGRVKVNREVVTQLGSQADPERDEIRVDGDVIRLQPLRYYLVNKPKGYICTNRDEYHRKRAVDLIPDVRERLYAVGRLDADSEGLLILTNDGDLANRLTHPRYGVSKTYRVEAAGAVEPEELEKLRRGVWSAAGKLAAESVRIVGRTKTRTILEFVLREGKNREIRRMLARAGHKVKRLRRVRIADLSDDRLAPGAYRELTPDEVQALRAAASPAPRRKSRSPRRARKSK